MGNLIEKALNSLTIEEIATMVKESDENAIEDNSLIKKVCSEVFATEPKYVTSLQMNIIVTKCAKYMSKYILNK